MDRQTNFALGITAILLLGLCPSLRAGEEEVWRLANYDRGVEGGDCMTHRNAGETVIVEGEVPEGKRALMWTVGPGENVYALIVALGKPCDLTEYSALTFWIAAGTELPPYHYQVRISTTEGNEFAFFLQRFGPKWRQFRIPLAAFHKVGKPDPKSLIWIAFIGMRSTATVKLLFDDICLVKDPRGWDAQRREKTGFEQQDELDSVQPFESEVLEGNDDGRHVIWEVSGKTKQPRMMYRLVPGDVTPFESVRFRIRAESPLEAGSVILRITDNATGCLAVDLPKVPDSWTTMTIPLGAMRHSGGFVPTDVNEFVLAAPPDVVARVHFDDLELVRGGRGDESWKAQTSKDLDFRDEQVLFKTEAFGSHVRMCEGTAPEGIEWVVPDHPEMARLKLRGLPADMEPFGFIRLRAKASRATASGEIHVRLASSSDGYLASTLPALGTSWKDYSIPLSRFTPYMSVDPSRIRTFELVTGKHDALTVSLRWLRFVENKKKPAPKPKETGKRPEPKPEPEPEPKPRDEDPKTETPPLPRLLPKPQVPPLLAKAIESGGKGARIETAHFEVYTDQNAVTGKLVQVLEPMHDFVMRTLGLRDREGRIPVYIFKNKTDYVDFCVDFAGYVRDIAERSAGHGCSRYLAFYFTQPDDPVLIHEMTHALVHRSLGCFGGCWLQEGLAVSTERAYFKKDAAREFRSNLRSGNYTSLIVFLGLENFVGEESSTVGNIAERLYAQSAGFLLFLRDGPFRKKYMDLLRKLTSEPSSDADRVTMVEGLLGMRLSEIESAWVGWGKNR